MYQSPAVVSRRWLVQELATVDLLIVQLVFVQRFSSNPNLTGLDEKALDENWAHDLQHVKKTNFVLNFL